MPLLFNVDVRKGISGKHACPIAREHSPVLIAVGF